MTGATAPVSPVVRPKWGWRAAAWVAILAAVAALAYVIALWGWHWLLPRAPNLKAVTLEHDQTVDDETYAADLERLGRVLERWRVSCGH